MSGEYLAAPGCESAFAENLRDILAFFDGRRLLSVADVRRYTGLGDARTVKRRFPFRDNYISAATLALCLCAGAKAP